MEIESQQHCLLAGWLYSVVHLYCHLLLIFCRTHPPCAGPSSSSRHFHQKHQDISHATTVSKLFPTQLHPLDSGSRDSPKPPIMLSWLGFSKKETEAENWPSYIEKRPGFIYRASPQTQRMSLNAEDFRHCLREALFDCGKRPAEANQWYKSTYRYEFLFDDPVNEDTIVFADMSSIERLDRNQNRVVVLESVELHRWFVVNDSIRVNVFQIALALIKARMAKEQELTEEPVEISKQDVQRETNLFSATWRQEW